MIVLLYLFFINHHWKISTSSYGSMTMRFFVLLTCFCFLLLPSISLSAQTAGNKDIEVEAYGSSPQDALLQAKRSAVEEGIGVILSSQTEVENFMLKKDVIITQAVGSVREYTLLANEQRGDNWYVKMRAVVSLDSITADLMALNILLVSMDQPRTMVLIQEENGANAETAIVDYLQGKGFDLIDPAQAAALMAKDDPFIEKAISGDPVAASKLGAENGAEYILVGTVKKSLLKNDLLSDTGMQSGQASLTAKVINCSNARIVATKSANGAAVHISPDIAMNKATDKAATNLMDNKLFEAIVTSFQDTVNNGANYELTIAGIPNYGLQKKAATLLQMTDGVVSVTKRSFSGGKLELTVMFKGNVDTLCDRIDGQSVAQTKLAITEVVGSRITAKLQ